MPRLSLLLALLFPLPLLASEPWADAKLPTSTGLAFWFDASRIGAARQADGLPAVADRGLLAVWHDASGHRRHLVQRHGPAQPILVRGNERSVVRFDGKQTWLGQGHLGQSLDAFTLFLVAAPRSNAGLFRGLIAGNELGRNDYVTGFTVDLGATATPRLESCNIEGKGFGGAFNLLKNTRPFGKFHTFEILCGPGEKGVQLLLDGEAMGTRARQPGPLRLDELTVGARFYSNEPVPPNVRGFFDGDIAEILLYPRILSVGERTEFRTYLARKHAGLDAALARIDETPPRTVAKPPAVQMFLPGFSVRRLPIDLPNINNVRYRPDGTLVALGYDGNIHLLTDSDGDGLEDRASLYWDNKGRLRAPIGMALTPPGYRHGNGVFVASKGKLSLLVESGSKGVADREIVVASGWKELPHGVDALGVALSKEGKVYFGLGAADFTNPYLLKEGKAHYDLKSERGTILEVSEDLKSRKIFATGIRFPVGLAFDGHGNLFATDQEGATWLPDGNPFDELLHVRAGRHFGFPPRHPRHLPGVIDEPSTDDYGPQHQSTCGLAFNSTFGPADWAGSALVTGYSRGKLYRTALASTPDGFVARTHLLASLDSLAVDVCVSPGGDLIVATHSGAPDWGSGPAGKGNLYKISFVDREQPRPIAAWFASPTEVRVSFDRPLQPEQVRDLTSMAYLEVGDAVRAGDRFEVHRPGYAVVQDQLAAPRRRLPIHSVALVDNGATLSLATAPQHRLTSLALTLPALVPARPARPEELRQHPEIDLDLDVTGIVATWQPTRGETRTVWLPHLDLSVAREFLARSGAHRDFWSALRGAGTLTLQTRLDLDNLLRPTVQPGSTRDHVWPAEKPVLHLRSSQPFQVSLSDRPAVRSSRFHVHPRPGELIPVRIEMTKPEGEPDFGIAFSTEEDPRTRPLPPRRFVLPWIERGAQTPPVRDLAELQGGNWMRGRDLFFGEKVACGKCHAVRGEGGRIGPDLSNLIHRDLASVRRDIRFPSAALNPDHLAYTIELDDGRVLFGVPRDGGAGKLFLGDPAGREISVPRNRIERMTASKQSLMPENLDRELGEAGMRDLLTFLLTEPIVPAPLERDGAPSARSGAEIAEVWKSVAPPGRSGKTVRILLAAGPKDHGPGEHDYPLWQRRWFGLLSLAEGVKVEMATGWPGEKLLAWADVIVFYSNNPGWDRARALELEAFLARGGGVVYLHYAVDGHREVEALAERTGLAWRGGTSRFRHGTLELDFSASKHPIARGLGRLQLVDESYWNLVGDIRRIDVLATGTEEGKPQPLLWARQHGKGRVFVSIPGHYNWTFDDPLFRLVILRGLCWAAGEEVDRLSGLARVGARIREQAPARRE